MADTLLLLRQRRWLVWLVFTVVFGAWMAKALLAKPAYRSFARLQIDGKAGSGGLLGELQALENVLSTEAELEIMRSHLVATGAARQLEPNDFLIEEHRYRPLDILLRRFRDSRPPCTVRVDTAQPAEGEPTREFVFDLGADGRSLRVERIGVRGLLPWTHERDSETVPGWSSGRPFEAFGRTFTLHVRGRPEGRRYTLALRSQVNTASWIQGRALVREAGRRTGVVDLGIEAETPELARRVAAAIATSYLALKKAHKREQARAALEFLSEETDRVRSKLKQAEADLDRYRADTAPVLLSERARWLVEQTSALDLDRAEQQVLLEEQRRTLALFGASGDFRAFVQAVDEARSNPVIRALADRLVRLELERDRLEGDGVKPSHPDRRKVESELRSAAARLRGAVGTLLEGRITRTGKRIRRLATTIASYEQEARKLPAAERRIAELTREVEASLQIHNFLAEKEQEAQIALVSTLAQVRSIDSPREPLRRSSPHLLLQGCLAAVLGGAAALLAAAFAEYRDRTIKSSRALVEGTGLALCAAIPDFRTVRSRTLRGFEGSMVTRERPQSGLAEVYRILRTNLLYAGLEKPIRTLAVTSALSGEGKTATVCNLAVACAQQGDRVLLVDTDLRWGDSHWHLLTRRTPGLGDLLEGGGDWRDAVQETTVSNLSTLQAGLQSANPAALLGSKRLRALLAEAGEEYDRVLVDAPPVLSVSDAAALIPHLDGVLLLVRHRTCTLDVVLDARDQIRRVGANLLGVVFNAFDARTAPRRAYGYFGSQAKSPQKARA